MLDEFKHIFKTLKKGIVVMENGKPSYVVVPFEEFERVANEDEKSARFGPLRDVSPIDDAGLIQKMIAQDSGELRQIDADSLPDDEIKAVLDALDREKEAHAGAYASSGGFPEPSAEQEVKKVHLEDLPF